MIACVFISHHLPIDTRGNSVREIILRGSLIMCTCARFSVVDQNTTLPLLPILATGYDYTLGIFLLHELRSRYPFVSMACTFVRSCWSRTAPRPFGCVAPGADLFRQRQTHLHVTILI